MKRLHPAEVHYMNMRSLTSVNRRGSYTIKSVFFVIEDPASSEISHLLGTLVTASFHAAFGRLSLLYQKCLIRSPVSAIYPNTNTRGSSIRQAKERNSNNRLSIPAMHEICRKTNVDGIRLIT